MPRVPYYVKEEHPETEIENNIDLIPSLFTLLGKSVAPWPMQMSSVDLGALLNDYWLVVLTQNHHNVMQGIADDDSVLTRWKNILLLTIRVFEQQFQTQEEDLSKTLFQILLEASDHRKEEYLQSQHVALSIQNQLGDEDAIRSALQLYQRTYEGSFRTLTGYLRYILELSAEKRSQRPNLERILREQVKKNLNTLIRRKLLSKDEFVSINHGVDNLVRDAVAHGGSELRDGKAYLRNGRKKVEVSLDDMQSLTSSIMVTCAGIRSGLWFSFQRHKSQIGKHVKQKYHIEKIHSVLYEAAKEIKFFLDECSLADAVTINLVLREMSPSGQSIVPSTTDHGSVVVKIQTRLAGPRSERVRDMLKCYSNLFYDYGKLLIQVNAADGGSKGRAEIQTKDLLEGSSGVDNAVKTIVDE
jgi:hypothetical protein